MKYKENHIYLLSILFLLIASFFSVGYHQFDEHFQILEFAGLKLGLTIPENLPWEYHEQIRSSVQPAMAVLLYRLMDLIGLGNPFTVALVLRLISAALSFTSMLLIYKVYRNRINHLILQKWFLILSFLLWFAIYNDVRFSSENWSGTFFIIAFALFFLKKKNYFYYYLGIGTLMGFSFLFRFQAGFLVAGFLLWIIIIDKERLINIAYLIFGITLVVFIGLLIDNWFYGEWTFTAWNYLDQNILQNKVSSFGIEPWWYYIETFFVQGIPPFSLLFILAILLLFIYKRKSPITWSVLPFLLIHFIIGHKEMRFLSPIIGLLPIIVIESIEITKDKFAKNLLSNKPFKIFMKVFFIVNFLLLLFVSFQPADNYIGLYHTIYKRYKTPAKLYYIENNPYHRVLDIHFYKRNNLKISQTDTIRVINNQSDTINLIVFNNHNIPIGFDKRNKLVYSSFPIWINKLNLNNFTDRLDIWYVYEIRNKQSMLK
jgi:phosphatidylinositol glycan class B